jgi:hypothetical protein
MAGTSGKPVVEKLGIKPGFCIFTAGAPVACSDDSGWRPCWRHGMLPPYRERGLNLAPDGGQSRAPQ